MTKQTDTRTRPSAGRPRSEGSKQAILESTVNLLEQKGYSALTIEGIAAHAGVSKATIYRWWNDKTMLVMDAFLMLILPRTEFSDSGSLRDSFVKQMHGLIKVLDSPIGRTVLTIVSGSEPDSEAFQAFRQYIAPRRADGRRLLEESMARGEVRSDLETDVIMDMIYGPIYFRILIHKKPPDSSYIQAVVDYAMDAILVHPDGGAAR